MGGFRSFSRQRSKCKHNSLTGKQYNKNCKHLLIKLLHIVYNIGLNIISGINFNMKV